MKGKIADSIILRVGHGIMTIPRNTDKATTNTLKKEAKESSIWLDNLSTSIYQHLDYRVLIKIYRSISIKEEWSNSHLGRAEAIANSIQNVYQFTISLRRLNLRCLLSFSI
jgi:hypothetical protein